MIVRWALATPIPSPTPSAPSGEAQKSGPLGLAVILVLCVACYFLFKSMSKHMRKVRETFPAGHTVTDQSGQPAPAPRSEAPGPAVSDPAAGTAQLGAQSADGPEPMTRE